MSRNRAGSNRRAAATVTWPRTGLRPNRERHLRAPHHEPPDGDTAPRSIGRRRALPTGRAVAGGFFVAVAAVLVFGAWLGTSRSSGRSWTIARHDLAAGTRLDASDLTVATMQLGGPTRSSAFSDPALLFGRTLASPLRAGELVQDSALVAPGAEPSLRPVAVSVDGAGATGLGPGQLVDVLVTVGSDSSAPTRVVVRGARVLAAGQLSGGLIAGGSGTVVTLGVATLDEVEAVVSAAHTGTVTVVLGEPSDGQGPGPEEAPTAPTTTPTTAPTSSPTTGTTPSGT